MKPPNQQRRPLSREEQLNTIMNQIKQAQSPAQVPVQTAAIPTQYSELPAAPAPEDPEEALPFLEEASEPVVREENLIGMLVQVVDTKDQSYGVCFVVGAIRDTKVHGYFIAPGRNKVFLTMDRTQVGIIGKALVAAREATAKDWTT